MSHTAKQLGLQVHRVERVGDFIVVGFDLSCILGDFISIFWYLVFATLMDGFVGSFALCLLSQYAHRHLERKKKTTKRPE